MKIGKARRNHLLIQLWLFPLNLVVATILFAILLILAGLSKFLAWSTAFHVVTQIVAAVVFGSAIGAIVGGLIGRKKGMLKNILGCFLILTIGVTYTTLITVLSSREPTTSGFLKTVKDSLTFVGFAASGASAMLALKLKSTRSIETSEEAK